MTRISSFRYLLCTGATAAALASAAAVMAHDVPVPDGHIPPNVNYGFEVIGRDVLAPEVTAIERTGLFTDVWSHDGYAYVGTFEEPSCTRAGVFIIDIAAAVGNYAEALAELGEEDAQRADVSGAVVAEIKSAPNTRVNDVKVHTVTFRNQTRDILVATEEQCGPLNGVGRQLGQGGISIYDVTNPHRPHAIKQHTIGQNAGIHNTFVWTSESDGRSYSIAVDDVNLNDVIIIDMTKPQSPKEIARVGIEAWLDGDFPEISDDGQLATGNFAAPLLHDVWVETYDGQALAVLSYWDAGFVILDVTDPFQPVVLGDTTYPDPDPIYGTSPAEGNGHAAVFGGENGEYLFAGDEDFDPYRNQVVDADGDTHLGTQGDDVPQIGPLNPVNGKAVYVGRACDGGSVPPAPFAGASVALIERGTCAFTTKAQNAEAQNYIAAIVFNQSNRGDSDGCETGISMIVEAGIPAWFLPRSDGLEVLGQTDYDPSGCTASTTDNGDDFLAALGIGNGDRDVTMEASFDGWGYLHIVNNLPDGTTTAVPPLGPFAGLPPANRQGLFDAGYLDEIGYFAPIELTNDDPAFIEGAGDLTMHNIEADPSTAGDTPTFDQGPRMFVSWYSLGMRAMEYRPGHWHTGNGDVFSWNVHEVGRFIAPDGSNFWGVHLDEVDLGDGAGPTPVILGSDRNTGLWIFTFDCVSEVLVDGVDSGLYCRRAGTSE